MSEAGDYLSEEEYEVERIVNHRKHAGKLQYLIKWKYYDDDDNTWESENNVFAVDLVQAYWADRGGPDALKAARKGKQFKRRNTSAMKDKVQQSAKPSTKRASTESSSTYGESAKRARIESNAAAAREAIAKSPSPPHPPPNEEHIESSAEIETAATVHEASPLVTDQQLHPPKETTPGENTVEAETTTSAHIVSGDEPINDDSRIEEEAIAVSSLPEEPSLLQKSVVHEESPVLEGAIHKEMSIPEEPVAAEEPPVSEKPLVSEKQPVSENSRTSEEPPALDMSPVLEESPTVGEPPVVKIPPVHEAGSAATIDKEPPSTTGDDATENDRPEEPNAESRQRTAEADTGLEAVDKEMLDWTGGEDDILGHDAPVSAAEVELEPTSTTKDVDVAIVEGSGVTDGEANNGAPLGMFSDTDEPTAALDQDQMLDIIGDDDMAIQQATVLNEQEAQRAMYGSVKSIFEPSEKNLKPISEIDSEDVIYDDNFPADPADWVNVKEVVAVTQVPCDTPNNETFIVVRWGNGILSMHPSEQIRTHCARQLISFYERSLKFVV